MSTSKFNVVSHQIPCQYIREYPRALADSQEDTLYLSVKQYIPLSNPSPQPGDVTIIAAHANGIPKELYEPFWDDLLVETETKRGFRIRAVWITDLAHQGESNRLNRRILGNDPSWSDHARDLLHLINVKRADMPRPLVGVGHSVGGAQLVDLSLIHPRLLTTLVLLDPVIQTRSSEITAQEKNGPASASTFRRDIWESREAAAASFRRSKFYQAWDPRVLDRWIQYGLVDVEDSNDNVGGEKKALARESSSSSQSPSSSTVIRRAKKVTLSTPVAQEVWLFLRPNYSNQGGNGKPIDRSTHADLNPSSPINFPFYRSEPARIFHSLPHLRPSALYVFASESYVSGVGPGVSEAKVANTGIGVGGSGGAKEGRVKSIELQNTGHMIPLEKPAETARATAEWITQEIKRWTAEEEDHVRVWGAKSRKEKQQLDEEWKSWMGGKPGTKKIGQGSGKEKAKI